MPIRFDHPGMLWLLLLAGPIVLLGVYSLNSLDRTRQWTAIALRLIVLVILVMILAGAQMVRRHEGLTVVTVIDESESIRRFLPAANDGPDTPDGETLNRQRIRDWLAESMRKGRRVDDRMGLVSFAGDPNVLAMPTELPNLDASIGDKTEGTDIASAIRLGMALFPVDSGKRMLLVSDGNDTSSASINGVLAAAREAKAAGIPIDVLPIDYQVRDEVMVEAVYAPTQARRQQTVSLRIVLSATKPAAGYLHVKHDGIALDLNGDADGKAARVEASDWKQQEGEEGGRYIFVPRVEVPMGYAGANRFEASFEAAGAGQDQIEINNVAQSFTLVQGKGRILFVDNVGGDSGRILSDALVARGIDLEVVPANGIPVDLITLSRYDGVIMQNVPAELVPPDMQRMITRYVNDLGGGLVMLGGPDSFGAGGWTNTPIDQILPVTCEIPSQTILPSGALVIVLDRSGSMSSPVAGSRFTQQEVANEAAVLALSSLFPQDLVGVVAFDDGYRWVVDLQPNNQPTRTAKFIRSIHPGGGTDIYPALREAYTALSKLRPEDAAVRHIILLTDGQSAPGDYDKVIQRMVNAGITMSTVGVGDSVDGQLLGTLAAATGGNYYPVPDPANLPQIFIKEARTIRKSLIREQPFTPQLRSTGSPIMTGINAVPQLQGLVLTGPRPDPRVFMPMVGGEGEPVFAHWQVGLGRVAAFTSDATNRWATDWLPWGGYGDFWARTTRAIARTSAQGGYDLMTSIENDKLRVRLDATTSTTDNTSADGSFVNFLNVSGSVIMPDGSSQSVTLQQVGPGLYETSLPAKEAGSYIVNLFAQSPGGKPLAVFGGVSRPTGPELRSFRSDRSVLEQVAQITGGRILSQKEMLPQTLFERTEAIKPSRSIRPLWRPLMVLLFVMLLLDVAARRIAWDLASIQAFARQRAASVAQIFHSRQGESQSTLGALKRRAAEVEKKLSGSDAPVQASAESRDKLQPRATRKFEAAGDFEAQEDFVEAVGGAKKSERRPAIPTRAATDGEEAATTSRLLDAKRRARQKLDENEDN